MKKLTQWMGVCAIAISSAATLSGCSSDPDPGPPGSTAGTGTGGTGAGTAGTTGTGTGGMTGTQLQSPAYHVVLSGAELTTGMPAPAAYTNSGCTACHGDNGEGNSSGPEIRFTPKEYARNVVRNGRKSPSNAPTLMIAFPTTSVSDADLDTINTWQNSFTKPTTGQGLYRAMCGNCHGPNMPTGGSAPISIQGKSKVDVAMYVRNGNGTDFNMRATYMPKFDEMLLTPGELDMIEMYLGSM
jgi:mono/diheme cytochrome c family protein